MAITKKIDPIPTAPSRSDPENFDERADTFLKRLETLDDDLNEWASQANSTAAQVNSTQNYVAGVSAICSKLEYSNGYKGNWSSGTTYSKGDVVWYNNLLWISNYNSNSGHTPGADSYWSTLSYPLNENWQLNLPFNQTPILVGGQDLMYRTFYVDATNGDDGNPGTSNAPFATLKKAVDSIPTGGFCHIELLTDIIFDEDIVLTNKIVWIDMNSHKIDVKTTVAYGRYGYYGFKLRNSSIVFYGPGIINLLERDDTSIAWSDGAVAAFIKGEHPAAVNACTLYSITVNMPSDCMFFCATGSYQWTILTNLLLSSSTVNRDGGYVYAIQKTRGVGSLTIQDVTLKDSSGNTLSWSDVIYGIVRGFRPIIPVKTERPGL